MGFLIWTWRVVLAVTVGAFVATIYYMTHGEPSGMDGALPALNLITVIGAALLGITWTLSRRYWHTLILLVALGVFRGLFGEELMEDSPSLMTEFQGIYVLVSIGVVGLVFVVTLTARALINDRAAKAAREAGALPVPGQAVAYVTATPPPAVPVADTQKAAATKATPKPTQELPTED